MTDHYPRPTHFVTIQDQLTSRAVLKKIQKQLDTTDSSDKALPKCMIFRNGMELVDTLSAGEINPGKTVVLFDTPRGVKRYKPLYRTQPDRHRPFWAHQPTWSIKLSAHQSDNSKMIRNCAQQTVAWFCHHIEDAIPGQSYPWGTPPIKERQAKLHTIASSVS